MFEQSEHLNYLDEIVRDFLEGDDTVFDMLSKGEQAYVALAANSHELLKRMDYTIAEAIYRLDWERTRELVSRWRFQR